MPSMCVLFLRPFASPPRHRHMPRVRRQRTPARMRATLVQAPPLAVLSTSNLVTTAVDLFSRHVRINRRSLVLYNQIMGQRNPWCDRAATCQKIVTVTEQQTLKHSPRMYWGSWIQLVAVMAFMGLHAAIGVLFIKWAFFDNRKPDDPSFWGSVLPAWAVAISIIVAIFFFSLAFTLPGKRRMKRLLLPVRCQRCPKCLYDLSQRPREIDTCPECGVNAPRRECVRLWCKLLRSRF